VYLETIAGVLESWLVLKTTYSSFRIFASPVDTDELLISGAIGGVAMPQYEHWTIWSGSHPNQFSILPESPRPPCALLQWPQSEN
jgi:hypothetical protein